MRLLLKPFVKYYVVLSPIEDHTQERGRGAAPYNLCIYVMVCILQGTCRLNLPFTFWKVVVRMYKLYMYILENFNLYFIAFLNS